MPKRVQDKGRTQRKAARKLPVLTSERSQVPCLECALCCSYVAVEIDDPSTLRGATEILWYLYHPGIAVHMDGGEWMVQFETTCRFLQDDNRCGIYETRPQICRDFDETGCEVNHREIGTTFFSAREFLTYLALNHKRIHTLLRKRYLPADAVLDAGSSPDQPPPFRTRLTALRLRGAGGPALPERPTRKGQGKAQAAPVVLPAVPTDWA
jgi:Fe-S-cluster containining protein